MNEGVAVGGRLRQATMRWQYFCFFFFFWIYGWPCEDFQQWCWWLFQNHSRFMRVFIKSEHGSRPEPLWPATSMACKLNERQFICLGIAVRQSCQGCYQLDSPTAGEKAKFICLFIFCRAAYCARSCLGGHEKKKKKKKTTTHSIYIYIYIYGASICIYLYDISRVCQRVFFRLWLLNFSPICSCRCEVCLPMVFHSPCPLSLPLSGLFSGLLSLIGSVCPLFSHICAQFPSTYFHYNTVFLLIFAYVMQQQQAACGRLF